jgi:hypothetical protein
MKCSNRTECRATTGGRDLSFDNIRQLANSVEAAGMPTKLEKELKREIQIGPKPYVLRIDPLGLKLTEKGHRKGIELSWDALVDGEAALAAALKASVAEE